MSIKRTHLEFEGHYTMIPNAWLRDGRLSLKARGLLGQLMSHTVGWTVSVESLTKVNPEGKAAIKAALVELEEAGYLKREQSREGNRFGDMVYTLTTPAEVSPLVTPSADFQPTGNQPAGNRTPKKNSSKKTSSKNTGDEVAGEFELILEDTTEATPTAKSSRYSAEFETWWARYPSSAGKVAAGKAFDKLVRQGKTAAELDELLRGYLLGRQLAESRGEFVPTLPHASTWLNGEKWDDVDRPATASSTASPTAAPELGQDDVDRILGRDYWTPPAPPAGLDLLAERQWRAARVAEHQAERRQAALARLTA